VRVIGGQARGTRIPSSHKKALRPTSSLVREALFNILGSIEGLSWLDLYAGTGSVGIEALSRGAKKVVFVEKNAQLVKTIAHYLKKMGYEERSWAILGDVKAVVKRLGRLGESFDIIFADPPYNLDFVNRTMEICQEAGILTGGGLLIIQHSHKEALNVSLIHEPWKKVDKRHYGDTDLSIIKYEKEN